MAAFVQLHALGLDDALWPGFGLHDPALARRALALLPPDGDPGVLVLAAAGTGLPATERAEMLARLAFGAAERDAILAAAGGAQRLAQALGRARRPSEIAAAIGDRGRPELVALAGAMGPAEAAREWLQSLRQVRLEIDGGDLLAAGIPAGPALGQGLRAALAAKRDGRAWGAEAELAVALEAAQAAGSLHRDEAT